MKEFAQLHHKLPLQLAVHTAEITTDRDKVTALMNRPATRTDMGRALMNKPATMEDTAMERTSRPTITRDMVKARGNTADMGDMGDIDMDGVVMGRHIIRGE